MKMQWPYPREDMELLRRPVLLLLAALLTCAVLFGGATVFRASQQRRVEVAQAARQDAESRLRARQDEEAAIRTYQPRLRQLQKEGIIGEEQRLNLVEMLRQEWQRFRLFPLQVTIGRQVTVPPESGNAVESGLALNASPMAISLSLLHENDLLNLLGSLRQGGNFLVPVSCVMTRPTLAATVDMGTVAENITASCQLIWLTLRTAGTSSADAALVNETVGR